MPPTQQLRAAPAAPAALRPNLRPSRASPHFMPHSMVSSSWLNRTCRDRSPMTWKPRPVGRISRGHTCARGGRAGGRARRCARWLPAATPRRTRLLPRGPRTSEAITQERDRMLTHTKTSNTASATARPAPAPAPTGSTPSNVAPVMAAAATLQQNMTAVGRAGGRRGSRGVRRVRGRAPLGTAPSREGAGRRKDASSRTRRRRALTRGPRHHQRPAAHALHEGQADAGAHNLGQAHHQRVHQQRGAVRVAQDLKHLQAGARRQAPGCTTGVGGAAPRPTGRPKLAALRRGGCRGAARWGAGPAPPRGPAAPRASVP